MTSLHAAVIPAGHNADAPTESPLSVNEIVELHGLGGDLAQFNGSLAHIESIFPDHANPVLKVRLLPRPLHAIIPARHARRSLSRADEAWRLWREAHGLVAADVDGPYTEEQEHELWLENMHAAQGDEE